VNDILETLDEWTAHGDELAVATVIDVQRSAPRPPGAKMAVNANGDVSGAVSGGCVEGAVVEVAEEVLRGGEPQLLHFGIADSEAWDVGLPCGGEIDVWVERYADSGLADLARAGERGALVTRLDGKGRLLVRADGAAEGDLGDEDLAAAAREAAEELMWAERSERRELAGVECFVDVVHPSPRLIVFGAVDYAAALCRLARAAGWRPYVVDPRGRFATRERFPEAEDVLSLWPEQALAQLGGIDRATYLAVLTHDPKLDDAALLIALRSEAPYVGAMGSRRAQARRRERLLEKGMTDDELSRLRAPIGLDLGALTAEETALSIMAEVVALRHGRNGSPLSEKAGGRIHELNP
jgi:xanthine dehydrogenase accessory factor